MNGASTRTGDSRRRAAGVEAAKGAIALVVALVAGLVSWPGCSAGPIDVGVVKPTTLLRGLVAHWPLDEGGGSVITDRSGNGHHGSLIGGTWVPGQFGNAVHFDGATHDEITVPAFPQGMVDWSVALWVRLPVGDFPPPPLSGTAPTPSFVTLISTENVASTGVDGGWEMNARLTPTETFYQFAYWKGPGPSDYVSTDCHCVERERWVHIAGVIDSGMKRLSFYRDGIPATNLSNVIQPIKPGSATLYMGRWQSTERWLTGAIDDIVIYDRALTPAEVMELSLAAVPAPP